MCDNAQPIAGPSVSRGEISGISVELRPVRTSEVVGGMDWGRRTRGHGASFWRRTQQLLKHGGLLGI